MTDDNIFVKKLVQFQRENIFNNKKKHWKREIKVVEKRFIRLKCDIWDDLSVSAHHLQCTAALDPLRSLLFSNSHIMSASWSGMALHFAVWRGVWGRGHGSQAAPHQGIELQPSGNSCWFSCLAKPVLPAAIYAQTFILYEWLCGCVCVCVLFWPA